MKSVSHLLHKSFDYGKSIQKKYNMRKSQNHDGHPYQYHNMDDYPHDEDYEDYNDYRSYEDKVTAILEKRDQKTKDLRRFYKKRIRLLREWGDDNEADFQEEMMQIDLNNEKENALFLIQKLDPDAFIKKNSRPFSFAKFAMILIFVLLVLTFFLAKVFQTDPVLQIGPTAVKIADFSGDGYSLSKMTVEYGTCLSEKETCIRLVYTINCEKKYCEVHHGGILNDVIKVKTEHSGKAWPYWWFNKNEEVENKELKRGESSTEMVVFKLENKKRGGVKITVDGQLIYQD